MEYLTHWQTLPWDFVKHGIMYLRSNMSDNLLELLYYFDKIYYINKKYKIDGNYEIILRF